MRNLKIFARITVLLISLSLISCLGSGEKTANIAPPEIISQNPSDYATEVPVNTTIVVTFNKNVPNINTISGTFTLRKLGSINDVISTVVYDSASKTATLTPDENLEVDCNYFVTLTDDIKDEKNNVLKGAPVTWIFTTSLVADAEAPEITSHSPNVGEQNVSVNGAINVRFNEIVTGYDYDNNSDGQSDSVTLIKVGDVGNISAAVTYNSDILTVVLTPASPLEEGIQYRVSLTSEIKDGSDNILIPVDWTFTTEDVTPPEVTGVSPADGSLNVPINSNLNVNFNEAVSNITSSTIYVRKDPLLDNLIPLAVTNVYYDSSNNSATVYFVNDFDPGETYHVFIKYGTDNDVVKDYAGNKLAVDYGYSFTAGAAADSIAPALKENGLTPDIDEEKVSKTTTIIAEFTEALSDSLNETTFILKKSGGADVPCTLVTDYSNPYTATLTPDSPLEDGVLYTVELTSGIHDPAGNYLTPFSWNFTAIDLIAPTAVPTAGYPQNGDVDVSKNTRIKATFSKPVQNVSDLSFLLVDSGSNPIAANVFYDDGSYETTLIPAASLDDGETYTVTLKSGSIGDNGIVDEANENELAADIVWSFTASDETDLTPPTVSNNSPTGTDVVLESQIVVVFSENVSGVDGTTVTLREDGGGEDVYAYVSYDYVSMTATLTPNEDLKGSTDYDITVHSGAGNIEDLSGNPLAINFTWSITTEADSTSPVLMSNKSPSSGQTNVEIDTRVGVTFNEDVMNVTIADFKLYEGDYTDMSTPVNEQSATVSYDSATRTATLTPVDLLKEASGVKYTVILTSGITDTAGNPLDEVRWWFETKPDTTLPTVMLYSETPTGISVPYTTDTFTVKISEDMDSSSFTDSFTISPSITCDVPTSSYDSETKISTYTITLSSGQELVQDTEYTITLKSDADGIKDYGGNYLSSDYAWSFTTNKEPDLTPPVINTSYPADGATDIPINISIIEVVITEVNNITGVNGGSFTLKDESGTTVPGTVTYDDGTKTATLDIDYYLEKDEVYTVKLTGAITDGTNELSGINISRSCDTQGTTTINITDTSDLAEDDIVVGSGIPENTTISSINAGVSIVISNAATTTETTTLNFYRSGGAEWTFTTANVGDYIPPTVTLNYPVDGATNALVKPEITAKFSEAVVGVSKDTFSIVGFSSDDVDVFYESATNIATLIPRVTLADGTEYTIRLDSSVTEIRDGSDNPLSSIDIELTGDVTSESATVSMTDTTGINAGDTVAGFGIAESTTVSAVSAGVSITLSVNATASGTGVDLHFYRTGDFTWTFTTATAPTVSSATPSDGTSGVSAYLTSVEIVFDKKMDPNNGIAILEGGNGVLEVIGTGNWSNGDAETGYTTVTYNVLGPLEPNTSYKVHFSDWWQKFTDFSGNSLNADYTGSQLNLSGDNGILNFSTEVSDSTEPEVISSIPAEGSTVSDDISEIIIRFDKPMDKTTAPITLESGVGTLAVQADHKWTDNNKTLVISITGASAGAYTLDLTGMDDSTPDANDLDTASLGGNGKLDFTVDSDAKVSILTEGFEGAASSWDFENSSDNENDWVRSDVSKTPNAYPVEGSSMCKAKTMEWSPGDSASLDQKIELDFSSYNRDSIVLSFDMVHETKYNSYDRIEILVDITDDATDNFAAIGSTAGYITMRYDLLFSSTFDPIVSSFTPTNGGGNTDDGFVLVLDTVDLSNVFSKDIYNDDNGTDYIITGVVFNDPGNKKFYLSAYNGSDELNITSGDIIREILWATHYIDLSAYSNESFVKVRLRAVSAGETGNNIIIDDLKIIGY